MTFWTQMGYAALQQQVWLAHAASVSTADSSAATAGAGQHTGAGVPPCCALSSTGKLWQLLVQSWSSLACYSLQLQPLTQHSHQSFPTVVGAVSASLLLFPAPIKLGTTLL